MIEEKRGETWFIREIIEALSLDWHRARALTCILTGEYLNAIEYLKFLRYDPCLEINAVAMSAAPSDPDKAVVMTAEAISADFGVTHPDIRRALECILPTPGEYASVVSLHEDIGSAIDILNDELRQRNS